MEKIFVQIASYRDPECQFTLKDMFAKAKHPERVFAGVCLIVDEEQDKNCFSEPLERVDQIRNVVYKPEEERGINWARMQAQSLWKGEDYVLQIHSHMRFAQDWDAMLIEQLGRCPSKKPVLSTSPSGYVPPNDFPYRAETRASFVSVFNMTPDEPQIMALAGKLISQADTAPRMQMHSPFAVGNFLFARASLMQEVPFDPYIYYYNSELAYSARLWTHGYDVFQPDAYILFHWYGRTYTCTRPYRELSQPQHADSRKRVLHLLRCELSPTSEPLTELDNYNLGTERSIYDYWRFAGIHPTSPVITEHARKGAFDPAYDEIMRKLKGKQPKQPTIFVQIASYRDPECQWTVKDLFDKATYPDRVNVGICWQYDPEEDKDCFLISPRPDQVRISPFHWKESQGVCWARSQAQHLYEGEDYVLMIDSHMRFVFGWDELILRELELCNNPKAVLSNHPASYTPPHELEQNVAPSALCVLPFTELGDIRVSGGFMRKRPPKPLQGAFIAAGFIFAKGDIIKEVPYDPYLYFNQEEVSMSARLYSYGWSIFHPHIGLAFHYYNSGKDSTKKRALHWADNKEWGKLQDRAKKRFEHLLGYKVSDDPEVLRDLMQYSFGDVHTLKEFEEFCGVDFKNRVTSDKAINYGYTEELKSFMRPDAPKPPSDSSAPVFSFPNPAKSVDLPYNIMQLANGETRELNVDFGAPKDVLIIYDYVEKHICDAIARYADSQSFTDLGVVDFEKSSKGAVVTAKNDGRVTNHVEIDGMAGEILSIFNDIYCNRLAPFYNANFEWYERPQILRYPAGGKYNQHADADHWVPEKNEWIRVQDRDYSVLLYLNDEYGGGELQFVNQNFTIKPKPGMLIGFPADHKFLHAALPTTSGLRYVIVSWAAVLGTRRVRPQIPYASVFVRQKRKKQA